MANEFSITPAGDFSGPLAGIGDTLAAVVQQKKMVQAKQELSKAVDEGDTKSIMKLGIQYPEFQKQASEAITRQTGLNEQQHKQLMAGLATNPTDENMWGAVLKNAQASNMDPTSLILLHKEASENPEKVSKYALDTLALLDAPAAKIIQENMHPKLIEHDPTKDMLNPDGTVKIAGKPKDESFTLGDTRYKADGTPIVSNSATTDDPAGFRALQLRAKAAGLEEGTDEYKAFMKGNGSASSAPTVQGDALEDAATYLRIHQTLPPGFSRNAANTGAIYKRAAEQLRERGQTAESAIFNVASIKADTGSLANLTKQTDMISAFENTAEKNLDMLLEQSKKVPRTGIPLINEALLSGKAKISGDPETVKLYAIVKPFVDEYAKVLSGSTGSQGSSDASRREAAAIIAPYMTANQIDQLAPFIRQELHNRTNSLAEQRELIKARMASGSAMPPAQNTNAGRFKVEEVK